MPSGSSLTHSPLEREEILRHLLDLLPGSTDNQSVLTDYWGELLTLEDIEFHVLIEQMFMGCFGCDIV